MKKFERVLVVSYKLNYILYGKVRYVLPGDTVETNKENR